MMNGSFRRLIPCLAVGLLLAPGPSLARMPAGGMSPLEREDIHQVQRRSSFAPRAPRIMPRPAPPRPTNPYGGYGRRGDTQPYGGARGYGAPTRPQQVVRPPVPQPRAPTLGAPGRIGQPSPTRTPTGSSIAPRGSRQGMLSSTSRIAVSQAGVRNPRTAAIETRQPARAARQNGMAVSPVFRRVAMASAAGTAVAAGFPASGIGRTQSGTSGGTGGPPMSAKSSSGGGSGYRLMATGDRILVGQTAFLANARPQAGIQGGTMGLRQMQAARERASVAAAMRAVNAKVAGYEGPDPSKAPANDGRNSWMRYDAPSGKFVTPAGLRYPTYSDGSYRGAGMPHVIRHTMPSRKEHHTVFRAPAHQIPPLLDEAWKRRKTQPEGDPRAYVVDMGREVGTKGETHVKIVMRKEGGTEVLTAYPCNHAAKPGCWERQAR